MTAASPSPLVVTIDGSIGAGKSTILEYINNKYNLPILLEPVDKWQPYLNELYGNKDSSAFNLQIRVWLDRCLLPDTISQDSMTIMERSPMFQEGVFVRVNREIERISPVQDVLIKEMYAYAAKSWVPHIYIYLRSDAQKCIERVGIRNRNSEDAIPHDYMVRLHELHEDVFEKAVAAGKKIKVVDVEGKTVAEIGDEVMNAINSFSS